ncbi:MAG: hypothetical protein CV090_13120, partial [Nitrospira sp. WS238]|nr:hypothetical protein [Nitrospira sp. WS238]
MTLSGIRYNHNVKQRDTGQRGGRLPGLLFSIGCVIMTVALSTIGCSVRTQGKQPIDVPPIPLTPSIWFSPSGMTAAVSYQNACHETVAMPMADLLRGSVSNKLTGVFTGVISKNESEDLLGSDGVVEVGLSVRRLDVAVPKQLPGEYPASATIGIEMVFLARDGAMLFSKRLEGTNHGTVVVPDQSCEVTGLEAIVEEAIGSVADGLAQQIAQSVQIREYADRRDTWVPLVPHLESQSDGAQDTDSSADQAATEEQPTATAKMVEPAHLSYRAIIRDENRNRVLEPDEALTLHLEVKNEGPVKADDVVVLVNGKAGLEQVFPSEVPVGSIQPGEIKRLSVTKQVTVPKTNLPGELTLNLRAASPMASIPPPKVFSLGLQSQHGDVAALPDVDELPPSLASEQEQKSVIIAIGIGMFDDEHMPVMKYAGHDAAVMAEYLHAIGRVHRERMRVL